MGLVIVKIRLYCPDFWVDVRLTEFDGRWLASADTREGPSLGRGHSPMSATIDALAPFDGYIDELILTAPPELFSAEHR
jgi:hypothetical protein